MQSNDANTHLNAPGLRRADGVRTSRKSGRVPHSRALAYHPAFGNGDTPHYGL